MVRRWLRGVVEHRPRTVLLTDAVLVGLLALAYGLAVLTRPGQTADDALLARGALPAGLPWPDQLRANALLPAFLVAAAATVTCLVDRRPRSLIALLGPVITYVLAVVLRDDLLTRPVLETGGSPTNTLPSAHVATAAALCAAAATMLGRRLAPWSATVLAVLPVLAAWANVASGAHRPSDTVAALLLAATVALALDVVARPARPAPQGDSPGAVPARRPDGVASIRRGPASAPDGTRDEDTA
ncbi:phosphatase PAP2 family protein [Cellulosimicrobium marinum]|uniref:phosphatase PAP2 family protein n=1 Tax=Cellulosimicrobium marinum TaxID=1638992 RepID=UPI001E5EEB7D|nr:phosphatase PAP2 family protein [Cellulosimicrobium marinum]MCB7137064.1 phosphatase PAP2 family protein [Cellulosimicrobium marinum]